MKHFKKIQSDMYQAMKSGEKEKANTLRSILAKLKDKQIEKRTDLTQEEEIKTLQTLVKQRKESIDLYQKGGRDELVDQETKEMDIINSYLPKMMDDEKIKEIVESEKAGFAFPSQSIYVESIAKDDPDILNLKNDK